MIPQGWVLTSLDQLSGKDRPVLKAGPFGSAITKQTYVASGFKVYGQQEVLSGDLNAESYYISEAAYRRIASCAVAPGDVLISMMGTVGKILEIPDGAEPGVINPRLMRISVDRSRVLPNYLARVLRTEPIQRLLDRRAHGGTMPGLNAAAIGSLTFLLPPLAEQQRIDEILSTWDRAIETVEALIANACIQKKALMQSLLTGKRRLPGFAGAWQETSLAALLSTKRAKGKIVGTNVQGLGVPYIGSTSFLGDFSTHTTANDAVLCRRDDILMLWDGEYAGKVTSGLEGAVSSTVARYRLDPRKADADFIISILEMHSDRIREIREGSGIPHMPGDFEHWFEFRLPPLDEQKAIAAVCMSNRSLTQAFQSQLAALRQEKSALMQQLLTGKRRVKADAREMACA